MLKPEFVQENETCKIVCDSEIQTNPSEKKKRNLSSGGFYSSSRSLRKK